MHKWKTITIGVVILSMVVTLLILFKAHLTVKNLKAQITTLTWENTLLREELGHRDQWIEQKMEEVTRVNKKLSFATGKHILREIWKRASEYDLNPDLIVAVIRIESSFDPHAVSNKGALGLMQVMPQYHPLPKGWNPFNIETNIAWGCAVLANYVRKMDSHQWAIRAYYAGEKGATWREAEEYLDRIQKAISPVALKSRRTVVARSGHSIERVSYHPGLEIGDQVKTSFE